MQVSEVGVISIQNRNCPSSLYSLDSKIKSTKNSEHSQVIESRNLPSANVLRGYYLNNNQHKQVSFRGAPWRINYGDLGISEYGSITAKEAIKVFSKLKLGNYLDIGDDKISYYSNKAIRDHNLNFLDRITDTAEKKKFIDYYKDLTGFPNLRVVSYRIKNELVNAIDTASTLLRKEYGTSEYDVVQAGYDGVCSVARGKALPGSDVDKAYVILKGRFDHDSEAIVEKFRGKLWENTDQRILSYNHDDAAFPQVYTERQIVLMLKDANQTAENIYLGLGWQDLLGPFGSIGKLVNRRNSYAAPLGNYNTDYVEANKFFIDVCQRYPKAYSDRVDILKPPSRENIKNLGFVVEAMREGEKFGRFGLMEMQSLADGYAYRYTNLSQLNALKKQGDSKPKRLAREKLEREFPNWSIDKQFRLIKTLIHGSCENNTDFTSEFAEYFSKSGNDPFAPLIKALMD